MRKKIGILIYCICLFTVVAVRKPLMRAFAVMNDQNLKGMTIVIDAGHGGNDPGARIQNQDEDEINLDLALKLASILKRAGAHVELTRSEDVDLSDEGAESIKQSDLKHRAELLNQEDVTLFVSLHCNTSADQRCTGSQVYYRKGDGFSRKLADMIQKHLRKVTSSKYIPASGDYYLLNQTQTCGALIEAGFLTNSADLARLQDDSYREDLAFAIYQGISEFLSILV